MGVKKRMRQSIRVCAQQTVKKARGPYKSHESKGRDRDEVRHVEKVLSNANNASNLKELQFYRDLYEKYGGDPEQLLTKPVAR